MIPRTINVSSMIAMPKLPTSSNKLRSSHSIGFSNQRNQPQSIARPNFSIPLSS
jgi:hypothetical protein